MPTTKMLSARLDVLSVVLQEMARVLSAPQAAVAEERIRARLVQPATALSGELDEAALAEVAPIFVALQGR